MDLLLFGGFSEVIVANWGKSAALDCDFASSCSGDCTIYVVAAYTKELRHYQQKEQVLCARIEPALEACQISPDTVRLSYKSGTKKATFSPPMILRAQHQTRPRCRMGAP